MPGGEQALRYARPKSAISRIVYRGKTGWVIEHLDASNRLVEREQHAGRLTMEMLQAVEPAPPFSFGYLLVRDLLDE